MFTPPDLHEHQTADDTLDFGEFSSVPKDSCLSARGRYWRYRYRFEGREKLPSLRLFALRRCRSQRGARLFARVSCLKLVPNSQNKDDVLGRKPTILRDIAVTAA